MKRITAARDAGARRGVGGVVSAAEGGAAAAEALTPPSLQERGESPGEDPVGPAVGDGQPSERVEGDAGRLLEVAAGLKDLRFRAPDAS